ncbi:MAG: hypothetical protein V4618_09835 [Pseudomonadota bacterium]
MSLDEEAEADREYYPEQSEQALKKPIMVTDDGANLLCCITLRSIMNKLDAGGATVLISPADDGSVQLQVEDPNGQWRGWRDYTLDFVPASDGGPLLLSKVVNAGQLVFVGAPIRRIAMTNPAASRYQQLHRSPAKDHGERSKRRRLADR